MPKLTLRIDRATRPGLEWPMVRGGPTGRRAGPSRTGGQVDGGPGPEVLRGCSSRAVRPSRSARKFTEPRPFVRWPGTLHDLVRARLAAVTARLAFSGPHRLVVQSADHHVLNLPWELVELEPDRPVGCDAAWALCRSPVTGQGRMEAGGPLRPGPLRILFLASAPTDQAQLDYERKEDAMLRAIARMQGVSVHFAESGSFDELKELVAECRPHVVHLSGHGTVDRDGVGHVRLRRRARVDRLPRGAAIVAEVFRGGITGCDACSSTAAGRRRRRGRALPVAGAAGVPLAVGWSASVADDRATDFAEEFYHRLVRGEPVPIAAAHARELIRGKGWCATAWRSSRTRPSPCPRSTPRPPTAALFDPSLPPGASGRLADQIRPAGRRDQGTARGVHRPQARAPAAGAGPARRRDDLRRAHRHRRRGQEHARDPRRQPPGVGRVPGRAGLRGEGRAGPAESGRRS